MKLLSVEIAGFRGFSGQHSFDLDGDVVVVVGANGHGKTSLFDAILWGLTGRIPRLSDGEPNILSVYSETGEARVVVSLIAPVAFERMRVIRSFDGTVTRTSLETASGNVSGPSAEGRIIDALWPDAASAADPCMCLARVLTQSVYLQQDLIRHFVDAETDHDRFAAIGELIRAGRITELQATLERAKKAWSTATNEKEADLRTLKTKAIQLSQRLEHLSAYRASEVRTISTGEWQAWWSALNELGILFRAPDLASREAPTALDAAIRELDVRVHSVSRVSQVVRLAEQELSELEAQPLPDPTSISQQLTEERVQHDALERAVLQERARLGQLQQEQARVRTTQEEQKTLAELALRHLGEHCPVCDQIYDREATRAKLMKVAEVAGQVPDSSSASENLASLISALATSEGKIAALESKVRSIQHQYSRRQIALRNAKSQLESSDITFDEQGDVRTEIKRATESISTRAAEIVVLRKAGELFSLRLAQTAALATSDEQRRDAEHVASECSALEQTISERRRTGEEAQRVIEGLREASSKVVQRRLEDIAPLLDGIYSRIDPHPAFRSIELRTSFAKGRGQISAVLHDIFKHKESDKPSLILSSSQLNALGVSIFLSLNLGISKPPLSALILDDPLQSLDDVHLLGLVDLFRRVKSHRQLLVSTHDPRFGSLLGRKLRPSVGDGRTIVIELTGWSRRGPSHTTNEIHSDAIPLRLAANAS